MYNLESLSLLYLTLFGDLVFHFLDAQTTSTSPQRKITDIIKELEDVQEPLLTGSQGIFCFIRCYFGPKKVFFAMKIPREI